MIIYLLIIVLVIRSILTVTIIQSTIPQDNDNHYCIVTDPIRSYTFNFLGLSNRYNDSIIRFDDDEILRVRFCQPLIRTCNGKEGYGVCLHKNNGQEVGVGKEPPRVNITLGKIVFKYSGDRCNATHNYTVDFEMKCDLTMGNEAAVDMDIIRDRYHCDFRMILETSFACTRRKLNECTVTDKSGHYNLGPLTDLSTNYEVHVNNNLTVILNVCHTLLFGEHPCACNVDTAICLINKTDASNISCKSLGKLEENLQTRFVDGNLTIDYKDGNSCYQDHSNSSLIQSAITFVCDLNATNGLPEYIGGLESCQYKFIWRTIAACSEQVLRDKSLASSKFCTVRDPITNMEYDLTDLKGRVFKSKRTNGDYEFSVCGWLRHSICKPESGVCRTINGKSYGISGGLGNTSLRWSEAGPYLNYTNGDPCVTGGRRRYTIITFLCGVDDSLEIEERPCRTTIIWTTGRVCRPICATTNGTIGLGPLVRTSSDYIVVTTRPDGVRYEYYINLCRPLTWRIDNCPQGAGICKLSAPSAGQFTNATNLGYPGQNPRVSSNGTVILTYRNGSACEEDVNKSISSQILFLCDFNIKEGDPQFKYYKNCVYYFEWKTKFACGKVEGTLNKNCLVTNSLGDLWNLTALQENTVYRPRKRNQHKTYHISICREKQVCNDSFICDEKMNYGTKVKVLSDYTNNFIKFEFTNGSKCRDGSHAQSILYVRCNESTNVGKPILVWEQYCNIQVEWTTNVICKSQISLLSSTTESAVEANNLQSGTVSVVQIVSILVAILLILIVCYYFKNASRRSNFAKYINNIILKYNLCCRKLPRPTENLCM